jgi:hypothetical protein
MDVQAPKTGRLTDRRIGKCPQATEQNQEEFAEEKTHASRDRQGLLQAEFPISVGKNDRFGTRDRARRQTIYPRHRL